MQNELMLILSGVVAYALVIIWFYLFKDKGLIGFIIFATISANIEVMLFIKAFGMEQTLGNVMFGATFLATDVLSELYGKKTSNKAVSLGLLTSVSFIIVSQIWLNFVPAFDDGIFESFNTIFKNTPRIMIASLLVYAISQFLDIFLYHKLWELTAKKSGDKRKFLWLRNNGSTLISQLINAFLFNFFAFFGVQSFGTIVSAFLSTYIIYIVVALLDTPVIYFIRYLYNNHINKDKDEKKA